MSTLNTTNLKNASSGSNNIVLQADGTVTGAAIADSSDVSGFTTTGSITSGTNVLTVASATGIAPGMLVVGRGIPAGTYVTLALGVTPYLSNNASITLSSEPVTFYTPYKILTPGAVGSMLCRSWVNFNGTGTVAIRASYNVSSITDNGVGDYTVNFTTAMVDANYAVVTSYNMFEAGGAYNSSLQVSSATYSTTAVRVRAWYGSGGGSQDTSICNVAIFR